MTNDPKWISEIRERLEKATPGPWHHSGDKIIQTAHITRDVWEICDLGFSTNTIGENAEFIANAPTDIKNLLEEREVLREALQAAVSYIGDGNNGAPPWLIETFNNLERALAWRPKGESDGSPCS